MARLLHDHDSVDFHINTARRHVRFCRQIKGGDKYATNIDPAYQELIHKKAVTVSEREKRQDTYDDLQRFDTALDNMVRTVFEKCVQFDREHITEIVLKKIFPDEKYSHIIRLPYRDEPTEVEKIAIRIESLGASHALYPLAAELREKVNQSRNAIDMYYEAIRQQKRAEAEQEIAAAQLRRIYEINYLEARKDLGKENAEQLFPQTSASVKYEMEPPPPAPATN